MAVVGVILVAFGVLIAYEALKGGLAEAATTTQGQTDLGITKVPAPTDIFNTGTLPTNWLQALAANESPSALKGDFSSGAFGLSCGATPGFGTGCTGPLHSNDPRGGSFNGTIYRSWEEAVAAFGSWVNQYHPEAFRYAALGDCVGFFQSINGEFGGVSYGGASSWPSQICSIAGG